MVSQRMRWLLKRWVPLVVLACSGLLAYSPLLWQFQYALTRQPWYGHIWIVPVLALLLMRKRLMGCEAGAARNGPATLAISATAWIVLAAAVLLWSPWLAGASLLVLLLGAASHIWGTSGLRRIAPVWAFLWLALPIPMDLDESLLGRLRLGTGTWASVLLDLFGVVHFTTGNAIEIAGKRLATADACGGMHSLQAMLACAGFYVLWKGRHIVRGSLFLVGAVLISLCFNALRVAILVWLAAHGWDLPVHSLGHTLSGLIFFAGALVVAWSWDECLEWLGELVWMILPMPIPSEFLGPDGLPRFAEPAPSPTANRATSGELHRRGQMKPPSNPVTLWSVLPGARYLYVASLAFASLGAVQFTQLAAAASNSTGDDQAQAGEVVLQPTWQESSLDRICRGWNRVVFQDAPDGLGMTGGRCLTWKFYRPGRTLAVSVAYPYAAVHDTRACCQGGGWQVLDSRGTRMAGLTEEPEQVGAVTVDLIRESGRRGFLVFAFLTPSGNVAPLEDLLGRGLWQRFKDRLLHPATRVRTESLTRSKQGLVQFQVIAESWGPLPAKEQQEMVELLQSTIRTLASSSSKDAET